MVNFVGLDNFSFLILKKPTFWIVVYNSALFAVSFVIIKAFVGFVIALLLQNLPAKAQRKWRAALLIPWVIPPAMSVLAWLWLFDPSFSALNWVLKRFGVGPVFWLGEVTWARSAVIIVSVWIGAPFFMVMYLAALKSVPEQLYEAAEIDGATWWQKLRFVTLPMTRNIIAITMLFSLIGSSGAFNVIQILTNGGPHNQTHTLATWAFAVGMLGGDIPLGASISLFTLPILAVAAIFILRNVRERGNEA
jgi:multiple sugar transport system permease protein